MQKYQNNVTSRTGDAVNGIQVTVKVAGGGVATIFSDNAGTPLANPMTTDANGYFEFYVANGRYDITTSGGGYFDEMIADALEIGAEASAGATQAGVAEAKADDALAGLLERPTSADLAESGGAGLVGYDGGTAQDVLDGAKTLQNYMALRAYTGRATGVRITTIGIAGTFWRDASDTTSSDNGVTIIVDGSGRRWKRLYSGAVEIAWSGAVGNDVADDTSAIQAALAVPASAYDFGQNKTYKIQIVEGGTFKKFTTGIKLFGTNVTIHDTTNYPTFNGPFTSIFWAEGTGVFGFEVELNYLGPLLASPAVDLGYVGATFVRASMGAKNITVNANIENARYGVQSGDYVDFTKGYCERFRGTLNTKLCGYPVALYLPIDVEMNINAEKSHRAMYLAGAKHARIVVKAKDQYIAPIQCLVTDARTGPGTSFGYEDVEIDATDMGSTIFGASAHLVGVSLSRADPNVYFNQLKVRAYIKATDTIATTIRAFRFDSTAKTVPGAPYTNNWDPTTKVNGVELSGVLDRSLQTLAEHPAGEIYMNTEDGANHAIVQGLDVTDFQYLPGSGAKPRGFWFLNPGLVGAARFSNCYFGTATPVLYGTNATSTGLFMNCTMRGSWDSTSDSPYSSAASFINCSIASQAFQPTLNKSFVNSLVQGCGALIKRNMIELTLTGASVTWTNSLPNNAIILGVSGVTTETITGATGYIAGTAAAPSKYYNTNSLAIGTSFTASNGTDTSVPIQAGTSSIVITPKTSNFTGGKLRLCVDYILLSAPTS